MLRVTQLSRRLVLLPADRCPLLGRQLVCAECHCWAYMDTAKSRQIRRKQVVPCGNCGRGEGLRPRVMLYDDDEGDAITPEDLWDIMKVPPPPPSHLPQTTDFHIPWQRAPICFRPWLAELNSGKG